MHTITTRQKTEDAIAAEIAAGRLSPCNANLFRLQAIAQAFDPSLALQGCAEWLFAPSIDDILVRDQDKILDIIYAGVERIANGTN